MAIILLGSFIAPILVHSSTIAIPAIARDLRLTAEIVSWFTFVSVMGNLLLVLPAGQLADIYGRKKAFCFGLLIAAIGCVLGGMANGAFTLLVARFLMGASLAFVWAAALALVSSIPRPENKVKVIGVFTAICYLGIVTGPVFGGLVIEQLNWRWVFLVPGGMLLPLALVGFTALNWERYGNRDMRLRIPDTLLYMCAVSLMGGAVLSHGAMQMSVLTLAGAALLAEFCRLQTRREDPLLQIKLFTENRQYAVLATTHMITYVSIFALPFTLTLFLVYIKGLDAQTVGWVVMVQALGTCILSPFNGWLATLFQTRTIIITGMSLLCIGAWCLTALDGNSLIGYLAIILVVIGFGVGLLDPQLYHRAMSSVRDEYLGSASATLNGMRTVGGFIGLGIVSALIEQRLRGVEIDPSSLEDLQAVLRQFYWLATGILAFAFGLLAWGLFGKRTPANGAELHH